MNRMKTLNVHIKIEALKYALNVFEMHNPGSGICHQILTYLCHEGIYLPLNVIEYFPELKKLRPRKADPHLWWWPKDESGRIKRIKALKKAIAEIEGGLR